MLLGPARDAFLLRPADASFSGVDITTTGRLDTRFSGPTMDPLSKEADYDPQQAAIGSAYVSAFNDYVRTTLKYGDGKVYKPMLPLNRLWNYQHEPPNFFRPLRQAANARSGLGDEVQPESEGSAKRRQFRLVNTVLRGHLRDAALADADQASGKLRRSPALPRRPSRFRGPFAPDRWYSGVTSCASDRAPIRAIGRSPYLRTAVHARPECRPALRDGEPQLPRATDGGFHDPSRIDEACSFGQYIRSIGIKSPCGAGSQLASL